MDAMPKGMDIVKIMGEDRIISVSVYLFPSCYLWHYTYRIYLKTSVLGSDRCDWRIMISYTRFICMELLGIENSFS